MGTEKCCEMLILGHALAVIHISSQQQLWLSEQDLHKIKPVTSSAGMEEGSLQAPTLDNRAISS